MQQLSAAVRQKLVQLQSHTGVRFDAVRKCFVDENDKRKHGLTKILAKLIPVASDTDTRESGARRSRARQGKNDPVFKPDVSRFSGGTMRKCGTCVEALARARALPEMADVLRGESDDKAHGLLVDHQMVVYAERGRKALFEQCAIVDPCVGTLLEKFDSIGWSVVGAQIPLHSPSMDICTACDLVCVNRLTSNDAQMFQVEVKASMSTSAQSDVNYERIRGRNKNTALRGVLQSYASRHQFQALCTDQMVAEKLPFRFDKSCVMRVSPGVVRTYDLHPWYVAKLPKIIDAIGLKTGKKRRTKKKLGSLRVQKMPRKRAPRKPKQQKPKSAIQKNKSVC
jgi:hypothetical protein